MDNRDVLYEEAATIYWEALSIPAPLNETLFSRHAYKYTHAYRNPKPDTDISLNVKQLVNSLKVLFLEDSDWFQRHLSHLKAFVQWCNDHNDNDYYLLETTLYRYLEFAIEQKTTDVGQRTAAELPEVTIHNHIK